MAYSTVLEQMEHRSASAHKALALLLDPDKVSVDEVVDRCQAAEALGVDFLFVGGSLLTTDRLAQTLEAAKASCSLPVLLFPSSVGQVHPAADAILFLSLISGRNPELLIGEHVKAAPLLATLPVEVLPTGYLLVDTGRATSATYMSGTFPLPADKPEIAAATALAGHYLGLRLMYLDGGSGGAQPIRAATVQAVRQAVPCPIIVGGGVREVAQAEALWQAGADVVVLGSVTEEADGLKALAAFAHAKTAALK